MPASIASSAPRRLGTRAINRTSGRRLTPASTSAAPAMAGTAVGDTNDTASISRRPASASASTNRARPSGATAASPWSPSRGPTSRRRAFAGSPISDRWHAVAPVAEAPVLALGRHQPGDDLVAQVLGTHDRIDHKLRREPEDVDVGFEVGALLGHERLALELVLDRRDLVGVHRV